MDYSLLQRTEFSPGDLSAVPRWDLFLAAYDGSERVSTTFDAMRADQKHWLIHREYGFGSDALPPNGDVWHATSDDEAKFWRDYFSDTGLCDLPLETRICVDITGLLRPHLMLLPRLLRAAGFSHLHVIYSEPSSYKFGDRTSFSKGPVTDIRQVRGFEGLHSPSTGERDLMVIGVGYEVELIKRVAEDKKAADKMQLFGLPGLQPHMYQESVLCADRASESIGPLSDRSLLFAPANDPYMTAQVLHDALSEVRSVEGRNVYLVPLSTKIQALGFALYYLCECVGDAVSMIFPYVERYSYETSIGLSRIALFHLELDWFVGIG